MSESMDNLLGYLKNFSRKEQLLLLKNESFWGNYDVTHDDIGRIKNILYKNEKIPNLPEIMFGEAYVCVLFNNKNYKVEVPCWDGDIKGKGFSPTGIAIAFYDGEVYFSDCKKDFDNNIIALDDGTYYFGSPVGQILKKLNLI
jgi:hypothetical protein